MFRITGLLIALFISIPALAGLYGEPTELEVSVAT